MLVLPDLRGFQRIGVNWLTLHSSSILADEQGLGKTIQVLQFLNENPSGYPAVVVCPAIAKHNWAAEIAKWCPGRSVQILQGRSGEISTPLSDFTIVNYDILNNYLLPLKKTVTVIADESHYLKNYKSQRTKSVKILARGKVNRFLLSGTPILNSPMDIYPQLQIIGKEWDVGGYEGLQDKYMLKGTFPRSTKSGVVWQEFWKPNVEALPGLYPELSKFMLRRLKRDVLSELPDKVYTTLLVDMEHEHLELFEQAWMEFKDFMEKRKEITDLLREGNTVESVSSILNLTQEETTGFLNNHLGQMVKMREIAGRKSVV